MCIESYGIPKKTKVSKLQKIANLATESVTGYDPIKTEYRPFPIKPTYRYKRIIDSEYTDNQDYSSPRGLNRGNRSHTIMHSTPNKLSMSTRYQKTATIDHDREINENSYSY